MPILAKTDRERNRVLVTQRTSASLLAKARANKVSVPDGPEQAADGKCYLVKYAEGMAAQAFRSKARAYRFAVARAADDDLSAFAYTDTPRDRSGRRWSLSKSESSYKLHYQTEFQGIKVSVENRKGSIRRGKDRDGHEWQTKMRYPYGRIPYSEGADGEAVDCYIGPHKDSRRVFVVHQVRPDTSEFDEDKVILGARTARQAKRIYLMHYDSPKFLGSMTELTIDEFKEKLKSRRGKMIKALPVRVEGGSLIIKSNPNWSDEPRDENGRWTHREVSDHGPVYRQFHHDAKGAIRKLRQMRTGEAAAALHHPDVGDIDLIWGTAGAKRSKGYGLAKLVKWHPEVLGDLQGHISRMHKTAESENTIQLDSGDYHAVVRLNWVGRQKKWLLTAFGKQAKQSPPPVGKSMDASDNPHGPAGRQSLLLQGGQNSVCKSPNVQGGHPTPRLNEVIESVGRANWPLLASSKDMIPDSGLRVNLDGGKLLVKAYRHGHWRKTKAGRRVWVSGHNTRQQAAKPEYIGFREWKHTYLANAKPANDALHKLFGRFSWSGSELGAYWELLKKPTPEDFELINEAFGRKGSPLTGTTPMRTDGRYVYQAKRWGEHVMLFRADVRGVYESHVRQHPDSMRLDRKQWRPLAASLAVVTGPDGALLAKGGPKARPHQMTYTDYVTHHGIDRTNIRAMLAAAREHERHVRSALKAGHKVPQAVLAECGLDGKAE